MYGTNAERTGGTFTDFPAGWIYTETDTNPPLSYLWTGSAWRLITEKDVTETLTNKTLTSPTINTPTLGAPLTVANGGSGAGTLTGILKGNGTSAFTAVTAPSGAIVGDTDSQTLTNKTLTLPIISAVSNSGTITFPTGTDTLVAKATTDTLTNKTLTSPTINTPTITGSGGTLTLPAGPDTLVARATTEELTNKTIDPGLNPHKNIAVHPGLKKTGAWMSHGTGSSAAWGILENNISANNSGTGAANAFRRDSTGTREEWTTGTTQNSIVGLRCNSNLHFERSLNPMCQFKVAMQQTTACRMTMGFTSNSAAIGTAGADPLTNLSGVVFFYDSTVDGNWHIAQNSGGASSDRTTIANVAAADTSAHVFAIRADNANTKFQYYYGSTVPNTASSWTDVNTVIPAAATGLGSMFFMENTTTAAKTCQSWWWYVEQDP